MTFYGRGCGNNHNIKIYARRAFQVVPGSAKALRAFQEPGGRGELTGERFEGADGLLGNGERVSLAGEDAGEDGL